MAEKPVMEETAPPEPQTKQPAVGADDIQNLVSELEAVGAKTPEDIRGMATASKEAGNLARMLGEIRSENRELKRMLEETSRRPATPRQDDYTYQEPSGPSSSGAIDLDRVVENAVWKVVNKIGTQQKEAQSRFASEMNWVKSHEDFGLVKNEIEARLSDPLIQQAIMEGQTTIRDEFHRTLSAKLKGFVLKSAETLKKVGKPAGSVNPDHTETGQSFTKQSGSPEGETTKTTRDLIKRRAEGSISSDDALEQMIANALKSSNR